MEYLQVFDEYKNALNMSVARDIKYNLPIGEYFMVVLIFIQNDDGKFLIQKTSKSRHSCFATTGGHVSVGDDAFNTVIKEVKEELGLDIANENIEYVYSKTFKNRIMETYLLKMNIDIDNLDLQKDEVKYVKWLTKQEIFELIDKKKFRDCNIEPFKKIIEYIKYN